MKAKSGAVVIVALGWLLAAVLILSGCSSFGPIAFSLESDYGRFTYQLSELPSRTLNDK